MTTAVCNASPLIVLTKAGYLHVLNQLFDRVLIPGAVEQEVLARSADGPARIALERGSEIEVATLKPDVTPLAYWRLGRTDPMGHPVIQRGNSAWSNVPSCTNL